MEEWCGTVICTRIVQEENQWRLKGSISLADQLWSGQTSDDDDDDGDGSGSSSNDANDNDE